MTETISAPAILGHSAGTSIADAWRAEGCSLCLPGSAQPVAHVAFGPAIAAEGRANPAQPLCRPHLQLLGRLVYLLAIGASEIIVYAVEDLVVPKVALSSQQMAMIELRQQQQEGAA